MPPYEISSSIIASIAIIIFLLIFSHRPFKIGAGRRFIAACVFSAILWLALLLILGHGKIDSQSRLGNLIAGILIFITSIPAIFPFYSIVSWGFRFAMLIRLEEQTQPISLDTWMSAYCNGADMKVFYRDRMRNLYRFGMVFSEGDRVILTPVVGRIFGVLAKLLYAFFLPGKESR